MKSPRKEEDEKFHLNFLTTVQNEAEMGMSQKKEKE